MNATLQDKLDAAVDWLGERWVLHPARHVQRGNYEQKALKCDVAATIKKAQKQMAKGDQA